MSASANLDLCIAADPAELPGLLDRVQAYAEAIGLPPLIAHRLGVICEELAANVAEHGGGSPGGRAIALALRRRCGELHMVFEDDGRPFDPLGAAAHDPEAPLEMRNLGGLGIHFVRAFARDLRYERVGALNRLSLVLDVDAQGS